MIKNISYYNNLRPECRFFKSIPGLNADLPGLNADRLLIFRMSNSMSGNAVMYSENCVNA